MIILIRCLSVILLSLAFVNTQAQMVSTPTLNSNSFSTCQGTAFNINTQRPQITSQNYGTDTLFVWYPATGNTPLVISASRNPQLSELHHMDTVRFLPASYTFRVRVERAGTPNTPISNFASVTYTVSPQANDLRIAGGQLTDQGVNTICANRTVQFTGTLSPASSTLTGANTTFSIERIFKFFFFGITFEIPLDTITVQNTYPLNLLNLGIEANPFIVNNIRMTVNQGACGGQIQSSNSIDFVIVNTPTSDIIFKDVIYCPESDIQITIPIQPGFRPEDGSGYRYVLNYDDTSPPTIIDNTSVLEYDTLNNIYLFRTIHAYQATGSYELLLQIEDLGNVGVQGCSFNWTKTIRIGNPERFIPDLKISNFRLGDSDSTRFNLNNNSDLFFITKTWLFGDGNAFVRQAPLDSTDITYFYPSAGTYPIYFNLDSLRVPLGLDTFLICPESYRSFLTIYDTVQPSRLGGYLAAENNYADWVPSQVSLQGILIGPNAQDSILREPISRRSSWSLVNPQVDAAYITGLYSTHSDSERGQLFQQGLGQLSWCTRGDQGFANPGEVSWLETPFISLDNFQNPYVTFRLWHDTPVRIDGVVFQYTLGNDEVWHTLGTEQDVDNNPDWFNERGIASSPGTQEREEGNLGNLGWSGYSEGWKDVRYSLLSIQDSLNNRTAEDRFVRFRLAYSSLDNNPEASLIAIQEFRVLEADRIVLWEHFVGNDAFSPTENDQLSAFIQNDDFALNINYFTNPKDLPLYRNTVQETAIGALRELYYGIGNPINTTLDGKKGQLNALKSDFVRRKLDFTPYAIDIQFDTVSQAINFNLLKKDSTVFSHEHRVRIAIVERGVEYESKLYRNVARRFLPSPAGISVPSTLLSGQSFSMTQSISWPTDITHVEVSGLEADTLNNYPYLLVVFVQDIETKEILQTTYRVISTGELSVKQSQTPENSFKISPFKIYPNPADAFVQIDLKENQLFYWELYDIRGCKVSHQKTPNESNPKLDTLKINCKDLSPGTYILKLWDANQEITIKKLVVVH